MAVSTGPIDLRVFISPQQGASYDTQLRVAKAAEELGFSALFRSDHFLRIGEGDPMPGPTDSWITLAGIARETERIRLGTLVSSATFRLPGLLAIQVAQVDAMSGGRVELGLGSGWFRPEHEAYGIPFPDKRFGLLEEQLAVITGLWGTKPGDLFDYEGEHYRLKDSPALPKPAQGRVPVIVGGTGAKRTPQLAARFATEFNMPFGSVEDSAAQFERVRAAVAAAGRPERDMVYSNALTVAVGKDDAEVARRAAAIGRDLDQLKAEGLAGTPDEVVEAIGRYTAVGSRRFYLQVLDLQDVDHLELIAARVAPQSR
jgi:F420-dependent oxidoreductase-like protein